MKLLSTQELKSFLYIQAMCLLFATVGLTIREFMFIKHGQGMHWSYLTLLAILMVSMVLQFLTREKMRKVLVSLGICYALFSVVLTFMLLVRPL